MELKSLLDIGSRLEIHCVEDIYISQIEDFMESYIVISLPIKSGHYMKVVSGKILKIGFVSRDNYYYFFGEIKNIIWSAIPLLIILQLGRVEKIQRRDFYRLKSLIHTTIKIEDRHITVIGKDISGSGMLMVSRKRIKKDQIIEIQLDLKSFGVIELKGQAVRITYKKGIPFPYECGIKFIDMSETVRDRIIKYIFEEQRRIRQKGMV